MLPLQKEQRDPAPGSILDMDEGPDRTSPEAQLWCEVFQLAVRDALGSGQAGRPASHLGHDRREAIRFLTARDGEWMRHRHWIFGMLGIADHAALDEGLRDLLGEGVDHEANVGADPEPAVPAKGKQDILTPEERRERRRASARRAMAKKRARESAWTRELLGGSALSIPRGHFPAGSIL